MRLSTSRISSPLGKRPTLALMLPTRSRFAAAPVPAKLASALGRSQQWLEAAGDIAQVQRYFSVTPMPWSVAALTRQYDVGDAGQALWLRADPVNVQPDQYGARMMAYGPTLSSDHEDVAALLPELQTLFAQDGWQLDAPVPTRWYLRLPDEIPLPKLTGPDAVIGADLFAHLPSGKHARRWRALLSESQVLLHQHPHNVQRIAQGKPAINSLWFWGAGRLPKAVSSPYQQIRSPDPLLHALAQQAGITPHPDNSEASSSVSSLLTLVDLRHLSNLHLLIDQALMPLLASLRSGELAALHLDFADGVQFRLLLSQRWKFWAKPVLQLTG